MLLVVLGQLLFECCEPLPNREALLVEKPIARTASFQGLLDGVSILKVEVGDDLIGVVAIVGEFLLQRLQAFVDVIALIVERPNRFAVRLLLIQQ